MRQISDMISMDGRVAAITGGCGHIGVAMAHALAEQGCSLLLIDRNETQLEITAAALRTRWPVQVATATIDLESEQQRITLAGLIKQRFGRLDVLINNAGFVGDSKLEGWVAPFEQQTIVTWRRAMEVNVTAAFHLSQQLAPLLRANCHGSILNVGSIYGVVGPDMSLYDDTQMGNPAAYAVSKGGVVQLTRWLSSVMAPQVRVNCISPGGVARNQPKAFADKYIARTPLKRMGTEEDFMGAVVFFCSDLSAWVTGENLQIDGGWTVW